MSDVSRPASAVWYYDGTTWHALPLDGLADLLAPLMNEQTIMYEPSANTTPVLKPDPLPDRLTALAEQAARYRQALLSQNIPDALADQLVRDWHADRLTRLYQGMHTYG